MTFLDGKITANSFMAHVSPHKCIRVRARPSSAAVLRQRPHVWNSLGSQEHSPVSSSCPISSRSLAYSAKATCQSQTLSGGGNTPVPLQVEHVTRSPSHSGQIPDSSISACCCSIFISASSSVCVASVVLISDGNPALHRQPLSMHESDRLLACGRNLPYTATLSAHGRNSRIRQSRLGFHSHGILRLISCRQPRIGQALSADRFDHRIQPLKAVTFDIAEPDHCGKRPRRSIRPAMAPPHQTSIEAMAKAPRT